MIPEFFGWEVCSFNDYVDCYKQFGGNFSSDPDVLRYIHARAECRERFFVHHSKGIINGAVCVWNGKRIANGTAHIKDIENLQLPIARDELILPFNPDAKAILPFKAKLLSPLHRTNFINSSFSINAKRTVSLVRDLNQFSKKTKSAFTRKLKIFSNHGGKIIDNKNFSAAELTNLYSDLMFLRRGIREDRVALKDFFENFRENIFGKVLLIDETPCAFMLNIQSTTNNIINIDFINIAINPKFPNLSVGTILMWININDAYHIDSNKIVRYSFGRPTADYKERFCHQLKVGRIITF